MWTTPGPSPLAENPVLQAIAGRASVREYLDREVPEAVAEALLRAAMAAPSAMNIQPWRFVVVRDREILGRLAEFHPHGKMLARAPLGFMIGGDTGDPDGGEFWIQDCSAAAMNLLLAAHALGLGAVWLGVAPLAERMAGVARLLALPAEISPLCLVAAGYPARPPRPLDKYCPDSARRDKWQG
ncbi:MAG: nitroreductase family protein [Planctomycetota bacterium]|jgi:nitroreductase|nr:nitroreductase family protein [Planctomycetota bacterium]